MSEPNCELQQHQDAHNIVLAGKINKVEEVVVCSEEFTEEDEIVDVVEEEHLPSSSTDVPCDVMNPFFYSSVDLETVNRDHSICHHCKEDLSNKRFYNHLFDHHGYTKQQLEVMKTQKRLQSVKNRAVESIRKRKFAIFVCDCGQQFASKRGLTTHKIKVHEIVENVEEKGLGTEFIVCPSYGCEMNFSTYMDLAIHVDSFHRNLVTIPDAFRIRRVLFADKFLFMKWKRDMEKMTRSEFFLRTTQKVTFAVKTMLFKCLYSNSRGQPKGRRCEQCPAFIRCCERNSGKYEAVACFGHLGHEHVTETNLAKQLRDIKWKEIEAKVDDGREGQIDEEELVESGELEQVEGDQVVVMVEEEENYISNKKARIQVVEEEESNEKIPTSSNFSYE